MSKASVVHIGFDLTKYRFGFDASSAPKSDPPGAMSVSLLLFACNASACDPSESPDKVAWIDSIILSADNLRIFGHDIRRRIRGDRFDFSCAGFLCAQDAAP